MSAVPASKRPTLRTELAGLSRYHLELEPCRFKLDQNEVPWELPRRLKERALARLAATEWSRYPDFHSEGLRRAFGRVCGWPAAGVLVGNGSNELLLLVLNALVPRGARVLSYEPSFGLYRSFVLQGGGVPDFLPPRADLALPIDQLRERVRADPSTPLLLCSPNNPTGMAATPAEVEALLEELEAPLFLDNAYGEFCRHDYRPLLHRHPHLLLFRTLSKAWGLGGLRVGALLADPQLVTDLIRVKLPYNLGKASAVLAEEVLGATRVMQRRTDLVIARREQWRRDLLALGLDVLPSEANYLLVRTASAALAERLFADLEAGGVRVRDVGRYPGLSGALRISVGGGAALRRVRSLVSRFLEEQR